MTRIQRLIAFASFLIAIAIVIAILGIAGALGIGELIVAAIVAMPISVGIYRVANRKVVARRR